VRRLTKTVTALILTAVVLAACSGPEWDASEREASADPERAEEARRIVEQAMADDDLRSVIVRITKGGENVLTQAWGESMPGVAATTDMHFRDGAVAISHVATVLLQLAEEGVVGLDDPLSRYLPDVGHADEVTLEQLAAMTSGYRDYVREPEFVSAVYDDPFRVWAPEELWAIATEKPLWFEPGTNWNYAHTNYLLLGRALEQATGTSMRDLVQQRVLGPLGMVNTDDPGSPWMPDPVLHSYTGERHEALGVPAGTDLYEDATYWSPSWTITQGAIQYTDIFDVTRSAEAMGRGELLSAASYELMTSRDQATFGGPVDGCPSCRRGSDVYTYGIGIVHKGDWLLQNPMFAGLAGTAAYLPQEEIAISVFVTFDREAFVAENDYFTANASVPLFAALAEVMAPEHPAPMS
jgi:CubicO group peptidase (beta-lactamase class C family)